MEYEVLVDPDSVHRFRRRSLVFLLAFPVVFGAFLGRSALDALLGREAG